MEQSFLFLAFVLYLASDIACRKWDIKERHYLFASIIFLSIRRPSIKLFDIIEPIYFIYTKNTSHLITMNDPKGFKFYHDFQEQDWIEFRGKMKTYHKDYPGVVRVDTKDDPKSLYVVFIISKKALKGSKIDAEAFCRSIAANAASLANLRYSEREDGIGLSSDHINWSWEWDEN